MVQEFEKKLDEIYEDIIINVSDHKQDNDSNSDDILSLMLNEFDLLKFVNIIIKKCVPKYSTFLLTFLIMQDLLVLIKGINPYDNMNKIFFTCFLYISNYYEDSNVCLDTPFISSNLNSLLLDSNNCMTLIYLIHCKSISDFIEYEKQTERDYIKFWINQP